MTPDPSRDRDPLEEARRDTELVDRLVDLVFVLVAVAVLVAALIRAGA